MRKTIGVSLWLLVSAGVMYAGNRLSLLTRLNMQEQGSNVLQIATALNATTSGLLEDIAARPLYFSTNVLDIGIGTICGLLLVVLMLNSLYPKHFRRGVEHGSEQWLKQEDIKDLVDKDKAKNMILSQDIQISTDTKLHTRNNNNVLIIGGSGTGKTWRFVKPNLMQLHSSYVVTDPKGEVLRSCGKMLQEAGYKISVLNLEQMEMSDGYNPFEYLRDGHDEDVMTLINTIMQNTDGEKKGGGTDPFWEKAEMLFLQAIFFYLVKKAPPEEQNLEMVMTLIRAGEIREDEENYQSPLDTLFSELDEEHIARRQYDGYRQAAGKTAKSIIISAYARLAPFNIQAIANLTRHDTLCLDTLGEQKTALFIILSPTNTTFNFLAAMMYTQLFKELDYAANWRHGGRLPILVRFILDEFANIGKIPNFEKILAYARSLNIGIVPIIQSLSQLKEMYEKSWETILDNCETLLFLGGKGNETLKYISELLGKETIDASQSSKTFSKDNSSSLQYQILGRELLTPQEVARLQHPKKQLCIVSISGFSSFMGKKCDPRKHKNYKKLGDYDKANNFTYVPISRQEDELLTDEIIIDADCEVFALDLSDLPDLGEGSELQAAVF